QLALDLHAVAVNRVSEWLGGIGKKVPEPATQYGRAGHLPEQPVQAFCPARRILWYQLLEAVSQIQQDGARLEHARGRRGAVIQQGRNLGIGVDGDKAASELVLFHDVDQVSVVLCLL